MATAYRRPCSAARVGISLLEVILAVAILGGALAVLGELFRLGAQNARSARELTFAQLHCESVMSQVIAGILPAKNVLPPQELPTDDSQPAGARWLYSIEVEPRDEEGLLAVQVTVVANVPEIARPIEFSLTQWIVDPDIVAPEEPQENSTESSAEESAGDGNAQP